MKIWKTRKYTTKGGIISVAIFAISFLLMLKYEVDGSAVDISKLNLNTILYFCSIPAVTIIEISELVFSKIFNRQVVFNLSGSLGFTELSTSFFGSLVIIIVSLLLCYVLGVVCGFMASVFMKRIRKTEVQETKKKEEETEEESEDEDSEEEEEEEEVEEEEETKKEDKKKK